MHSILLRVAVVLIGTAGVLVVASTRPALGQAPAASRGEPQARFAAAPGRRGYWRPVGAPVLTERGATPVQVNEAGLLANPGDVDRVAPFQPWSRAVYLYRQHTMLADDPLRRCLPPGGPRQFQTAQGVQFVEQRDLGRILVLLGGGNRNWRVIHTDGRPLGQPAEAVPSYYGFSVGRWEKDTLIVDSVGYNERFWFTSGGLPHTEALHLTERFTRTDPDTLRYDVTVDDARTYTRPWSGGWTLRWVADEEIQEYFCEEHLDTPSGR